MGFTGSYDVSSPWPCPTTTSGRPATQPANVTTPDAAASTGSPGSAARSTPRCPAPYGWSTAENGRTTVAGWIGQVQPGEPEPRATFRPVAADAGQQAQADTARIRATRSRATASRRGQRVKSGIRTWQPCPRVAQRGTVASSAGDASHLPHRLWTMCAAALPISAQVCPPVDCPRAPSARRHRTPRAAPAAKATRSVRPGRLCLSGVRAAGDRRRRRTEFCGAPRAGRR